MSRRGSRQFKKPSGFEVEVDRTGELLGRLLARELDRFFDISPKAAPYRVLRGVVLTLALGVMAFGIHLVLAVNPILTQASPMQLPQLITTGVLSVVRIGLVIGLAILFALQLASDFLADIFELKDWEIARDFISQVAVGGKGGIVHLRDGRIPDEEQNSPIIRIGGPGRVVAEDDTAALFERPDGIPHVVGPAVGSERPIQNVLTGFERLREPVVSLRDQYVGTLGGAPLSIVSRSMEGIPISAVDVRALYSLRRRGISDGSEAATPEPYPFDPRALEDLIYSQTVPVLTEGAYPSGLPGPWNGAMHELISTALSRFMSQNRMSEYVAGVGEKEIELSEFREDTILTQTARLSSQESEVTLEGEAQRAAFHPRSELTAQLLSADKEFARRAAALGLELHWIGVGTWKIPDAVSGEAVKQKHLEAWRAHRETAERADPRALQSAAEDALVEEKLRLVREVPIASHKRNQARYQAKEVLIECLLQDFWEQMGDALNASYVSGSASPDQKELEDAVSRLEDLLKIRQLGYLVAGGTMSRVKPKSASASHQGPPAPASRGEGEKYAALLGKVDGDYRAAESMIANEGRRRPGMTRTELIERILTRFERYGR